MPFRAIGTRLAGGNGVSIFWSSLWPIVSPWPSGLCLRLCGAISRTSSSISTSAGGPRPYTFDQPVRIVDIDDELIATNRPLAVAARDDGVTGRRAGEGERGRDRLRRALFREGSAERGSEGLRATAGAQRRSGGTLRGAGGRGCRIRPRDFRPAGRSRHVLHHDPERRKRQARPEREPFVHRRDADAHCWPTSMARSRRSRR